MNHGSISFAARLCSNFVFVLFALVLTGSLLDIGGDNCSSGSCWSARAQATFRFPDAEVPQLRFVDEPEEGELQIGIPDENSAERDGQEGDVFEEAEKLEALEEIEAEQAEEEGNGGEEGFAREGGEGGIKDIFDNDRAGPDFGVGRDDREREGGRFGARDGAEHRGRRVPEEGSQELIENLEVADGGEEADEGEGREETGEAGRDEHGEGFEGEFEIGEGEERGRDGDGDSGEGTWKGYFESTSSWIESKARSVNATLSELSLEDLNEGLVETLTDTLGADVVDWLFWAFDVMAVGLAKSMACALLEMNSVAKTANSLEWKANYTIVNENLFRMSSDKEPGSAIPYLILATLTHIFVLMRSGVETWLLNFIMAVLSLRFLSSYLDVYFVLDMLVGFAFPSNLVGSSTFVLLVITEGSRILSGALYFLLAPFRIIKSMFSFTGPKIRVASLDSVRDLERHLQKVDLSSLIAEMQPAGVPTVDITFLDQRFPEAGRKGLTGKEISRIVQSMISAENQKAERGSPKRAAKNFIACVMIIHYKVPAANLVNKAKEAVERADKERDAKPDSKIRLDVSFLEMVKGSYPLKANVVGLLGDLPRLHADLNWTSKFLKDVGLI